MKNNLFISYDLNSPGQDYTTLIKKIQSLGSWAKVQKSHWYVRSNHSATEARELILPTIDNNDSLIVIEANEAAWYNLDVSDYLRSHWHN